jgi:hypothetical protein
MKKILNAILICFAMSLYLKSTSALASENESKIKNSDRLTLNTSEKDSIIFEYVRVSYDGNKIRAYYEDGKIEDLMMTLNLKEKGLHGILTDQKLNNAFFEIAKYLRTKGYYLVTSQGAYGPSGSSSIVGWYLEYIYLRESKIH